MPGAERTISLSNVIKAGRVVVVRPPDTLEKASVEAAPVGGNSTATPAERAARTLLSVAPLLVEAQRRARQTVEEAREQADVIIQQAVSEKEAVLAQARSEGFEAGRAEGYQEGAAAARREAQARLEALAAMVDELAHARDAAAARHEEDIVELALAVAARIVRRESSLCPDTVRELLRETLPRLGGVKRITVSVHPEDLAALKSYLQELAARAGRAEVKWEADPSIMRGGCYVQTDRGDIDATVETRVTRIVESLMEVIARGH